MNKITEIIFTLILFSFLLIGCNKLNERKSYIFENGNQKVEFKLRNGNDYLEFDKNLPADFILTNVDHTKFIVVGAGIRVRGTKNDTMRTEIKVLRKNAKNDTLSIKIRYGEKPYIHHEFRVPIKNAE